jgi:hypothetical protein
MAFNHHLHLGVAPHPFRLALQDRALICADIAAIKIKENAITNIGDQIFLAAGADIARTTSAGTGAAAGIIIGAGGQQREAGNTKEFQLHDRFPFRKNVALCGAVKAETLAVKPKPTESLMKARATMSGLSHLLASAKAVH